MTAPGPGPRGEGGWRGEWYKVAAPCLLIVILHLLMSRGVLAPTVFADEMGYLGTARYLAGTASMPDLSATAYYHPGYSLLLLPAFWLARAPAGSYQAVLWINALLAGLFCWSLSLLVRRCTSLPPGVCAWVAFATCLYPPFLLQSQIAWAENAFLPAYVFAVLAAISFWTSKSMKGALALAAATGVLIAIHPRGLVAAGATVVLLALLALVRALPVLPAGAAVVLISLEFWGLLVVKSHLLAEGWRGGHIGGGAFLKGGGILTWASALLVLVAVSGQILYLIGSTGCWIWPGLRVLSEAVSSAVRPGGDRCSAEPRAAAGLFLLATASAMLATSVAVAYFGLTEGAGTRGDYLIYGRYNEGWLAPLLALGLAEGWSQPVRGRSGVRLALLLAGGCLLLGGLVQLGAGSLQPGARLAAPNVFGVFAIGNLAGAGNPWLLGAGLGGLCLLVGLAWRWSRLAGAMLLLAWFGAATAYAHLSYTLPTQRRAAAGVTLPERFPFLRSVGEIGYDQSYRDNFTCYSYQFQLPGARFVPFASGRGDSPPADVVVGGMGWPDAPRLGAVFAGKERGRETALWILPGSGLRGADPASFVNRDLGGEEADWIWEAGFYGGEGPPGGRFRWTDGAASLRIPVAPLPAHNLVAVHLVQTAPEGSTFALKAQGRTLFEGRVGPGPWKGEFPLEGSSGVAPLVILLESDTWVPREVLPGSRDGRRLGVCLRSVRLLPGVTPAPAPEAGGGGRR